jgi:23S rRNA pseudouridine2605 synthase
MTMRLQRALAAAGVGSRRACEDLIRAGRVTVDGVVAELGMSVDPDHQSLEVDGRSIRAERKEYWLLNKTAGVVSTVSDPQGRETVVDCVPAGVRVYPVGRLDQFTTGLLLLTNDGELANRLLHPRYGVGKEYRALVRGRIDDRDLQRLCAGVQLDDGPTAPASVRLVTRDERTTEVVMVIHEGRNRQVRRMLEAIGHSVLRLHRTRFDGLSDEGLGLGWARALTMEEVARLRSEAGLE